ncbi:MAG: hypothetical protein DRN17_00030 [Thermoplasmata archaeon]|nr:MAG: hypothetical protein DRN17_00030 [Thermoplasmata archaeon]
MTDKKPKYNFVRLDKNAYAILKRTKARLRKGGRVASYSDVIRYIAGEEKEAKDGKKESKN